MFCYFPGTALCGLVIATLVWRAWHVICAITDVILKLGEFAGIALLATIVLAVATLIVGFIEWTARTIRRRRSARGACLTCPHPCQQAQVDGARVVPLPVPQMRAGDAAPRAASAAGR